MQKSTGRENIVMSVHDKTIQESPVAVTDEPFIGAGNVDPEAASRVNKWGQMFIRYLFSASKTVQVHDLKNKAAQNVLIELTHILEELMKMEGRLSVRILNDFLYLNNIRLAVDSMNFGIVLYLVEELKFRKVEQIEFFPGVTTDELGTFLRLFFIRTAADDAFGDLQQKVVNARVLHIKLVELIERQRTLRDSTIDKRKVRDESNRVFFRAVLFMAEVLKSIERKHVIQTRKAERLAQQIFDILRIDDSILVGLTNIRNFDEYTFTHSVNVCILSMLIGERLHLNKDEVARLGVAALLHDIGKMSIPTSILNKADKLTAQEWQLMKYHTMYGVKELSRIKSLNELSDALFVTLQHHIQYNMNGYPQRPGGWYVPLFPRIVTIADYYDAMTTSRVYHRDPLMPDRAMRFIFDRSGSVFDPLLARVFIKAMGIYPNGTVVELDSGHLAVVIRQNNHTELLHRPVVVMLQDCVADDPDGKQIDLAERSPGTTKYPYSIVRTVFDKTAEIHKSHCFLIQ
jgi:HD-GYP domain-containing protein (c-di-GMP phosphodiesterase class II)